MLDFVIMASPIPPLPSIPEPPDEIRARLNLEAEKDPELQKLANDEKAVLLCMVAPYRTVRISPVDEVRASIGLHEEFAVEAVLEEIASKRVSFERLLLLLNTPGGGLHSSFKVARALRDSFKHIEIFVPHMAASGGTLISLIADKIIMGRMSQLSPVDPQLPYKGRRVSALFVRHAFNRLCKVFETKTRDEAPYPHQALAEKLDPVLMEVDHAAVRTALGYAVQILSQSGYDEEKANEIASELVFGYPDHDSDIDVDLADGLGLRVERYDSSTRNRLVWTMMRRWLGKYLYVESRTHAIRYVFPTSLEETHEEQPKSQN